jgi:hypothetical protein
LNKSLYTSLRFCLADPVAELMLSGITGNQLRRISTKLAQTDPYGDHSFLARSLEKVSGKAGSVTLAIEHQIWCMVREAQWATGRLTSKALQRRLVVEGEQWIKETEGFPTLIASPMTLGTLDAVNISVCLRNRFGRKRPFLFYGEGMDALTRTFPILEGLFAGSGADATKRILRLLHENGVFATYPDFVYSGHAAIAVSLFGVERPMSAAFVALASRPGTMLLPCLQFRHHGDIRIRFFEPANIEFDGIVHSREERTAIAQSVGNVLAGILEDLIRTAPEQWLLLPTLTCESPQASRFVQSQSH